MFVNITNVAAVVIHMGNSISTLSNGATPEVPGTCMKCKYDS